MTISGQVEIIRGFINNPRIQFKLIMKIDSWNMLCSSLDTIGDTELAIDAYIEKKDTDDDGGKYLTAYGILQVLFVQQESVKYLHKSLGIEYFDDPTLKNIREIRNDSVGHPIRTDYSKRPVAFNFITRISLTKRGFVLMKTFPDERDPEFITVDMIDLVKKQQRVHNSMLSAVSKHLREEDMKHKKTFAKEKLENILPRTLSYYVQKVIEAIHGGKPSSIGLVHANMIADHLGKLKNALRSREIYEAYDSVKYEIELLEYPLSELQSYFEEAKRSHINEKDAYIFADFVGRRIEKLRDIATEIDKEYSSV